LLICKAPEPTTITSAGSVSTSTSTVTAIIIKSDPISEDPPRTDSSPHKSHTAAIVGGTIGGLAGVIILLGLAGWLYRRKPLDKPSPTPKEIPDSANSAPEPHQLEGEQLYEADSREAIIHELSAGKSDS
jgi:hypothetical protein